MRHRNYVLVGVFTALFGLHRFATAEAEYTSTIDLPTAKIEGEILTRKGSLGKASATKSEHVLVRGSVNSTAEKDYLGIAAILVVGTQRNGKPIVLGGKNAKIRRAAGTFAYEAVVRMPPYTGDFKLVVSYRGGRVEMTELVLKEP